MGRARSTRSAVNPENLPLKLHLTRPGLYEVLVAILGLAGDLDLLESSVFILDPLIAVLYEHPVNFKALQYMGEAAGLQRTVGGLQYRVLVATVKQHWENAQKREVLVLRTTMFLGSSEVVRRFADALTGGDVKKLSQDLKVIEDSLKVRYAQ